MMPTKPFPTRSAALESLAHLTALARIGLRQLEKRHRIKASHVARQVDETERGLVAIVKAHDWRARR